MVTNNQLGDIANVLRRDSLIMTSEAGSGHPTSCLSCAEIMACLFFDEMKYDLNDPDNKDNDEFILSKGHAAPILYSSLYRAKAIKESLKSLRKLSSPLEGHPSPRDLKWIKVATGSLGQGLSIGVGMALAGKLDGRKFRTYVLLGDSECAEGSVYESLQLGDYYNLNNLVAIVDINRLGQTRETMLGHDIKSYEERFKGFNWHVESVDGNDVRSIREALERVRKIKKPSVILAKTFKGKGVSFLENKEGWHGKVLNEEELNCALEEIKDSKMPLIKIKKPDKTQINKFRNDKVVYTPYDKGGEVATREAYGKALSNLVKANERVIVVDGEVSNSTKSEEVKKINVGQFIEGFIAEQNLIGMVLGLSKKGYDVYGSTFGAFWSRAHDQIRMASLSNGNFTLSGSHAGVSIGEDGASQMALEDISMFRALPDSIVFYPSDAISTEKIVENCRKLKGIKYIRTTRGKTRVIYDNNEEFEIGEFKIVKESENDRVVLVGAGITLHEALWASDILEKRGIKTAVVDLYCIKPFNSRDFIRFVKEHGNKVVISEDHYKEGGIGEMISSVLINSNSRTIILSVNEIPHSGDGKKLLEKYGINAMAIVKAVKKLI